MKYIIITYRIVEMGGGQQYCRNKAETLKEMGYEVIIFSAVKGKIYIQDLKQYEYGIIEELQYPTYSFKRSRIRDILKYMAQLIGDVGQSSIVESTSIAAAQWGEMLAQEIRCKHFLFNIQEIHAYSPSELEFLKFKLDRNELAGISSKSVNLIFKGLYVIEDSKSYQFSAHCTNVVSDVEHSIADDLPLATYNIGSLGRLGKVFVYPTLCQLAEFIEENQNKTFNIVLIGGGSDKEIKRIKNLFKGLKNVNLLITGYIYPVPRRLIQKMDVFFSTAGSTRVTMREKIPTIAMTADTGKPLGILNYTTTDTLYGESEYSFIELLQMILFDNYCSTNADLGMVAVQNDYNFNNEVRRQLRFINQNTDRAYYDIFLIKPETVKHKLYFVIGRLFCVRSLGIGRAIIYKFRTLRNNEKI